jgi:hypothetical protein
MPELGPYGSVRGALSNERPYRDLRNVVANYRFEKSCRFPRIQPNSGRRDCSRLSCGVGDTQQKASGWSSRRAPLPATRPPRRRSPAFAGRHDLCHCLAAALACLQDDFEACITHLRFPLAHRQAIRTTNLLEQLFGEERRRTKVIPHAFGERAMLKLMYAASDPSGRTLARLAHERIRAPTADRHS